MSDAIRVSIGFNGGQVLALRMSAEQLQALSGALGSPGWHEIAADEGPVRVDLGKIVYVSSEKQEPRVGFG